MARPSTIETLPPELRTAFDRFLATRKDLTIDDVTAWLNEQLAGSGVQLSVSRSAVGRYRKSFEEVAAHIRESREIASAFARELGAVPEGDMGGVLIEMLRSLVYKVGARKLGDDAVDPVEIARLAKAVKDLAAGTKLGVEAEAKIREQARRELEAEARSKVSTAVGDGRLDAETAEEAMRIMGFV